MVKLVHESVFFFALQPSSGMRRFCIDGFFTDSQQVLTISRLAAMDSLLLGALALRIFTDSQDVLTNAALLHEQVTDSRIELTDDILVVHDASKT